METINAIIVLALTVGIALLGLIAEVIAVGAPATTGDAPAR